MRFQALAWAPPRQANRMLALIRIAALPVILAGERLAPHHPAQNELFLPILLAAGVYAFGAAVATEPSGDEIVPASAYAALDLAFICALAYTSGGPFSELRYAYFFLPLGAALIFRPRHAAVASLASVLAYVLIALVHPASDVVGGAVRQEIVFALYLAWMGVAAILLSVLITRRADEVEALAEGRGRLVAQALDAEDRERRRLAEALHDEAIQNLLAARHELAWAEEPANGNGAKPVDLELVRIGLDRTVGQLRDAVFNLHPSVLDHAGLAAALDAVAERQASRGEFDWTVDVDPDATGIHDQLLFSLARELITNAAKHSGARTLSVSVQRRGAAIELEVADDGRGLDEAGVREAPLRGHIGLASSAERVEALDGQFEIDSGRHRGTRVRATLPIR